MSTVTRMFPLDGIKDIHDDDLWEHTEYIGIAPRTDSLGEEHWGIFDHDGTLYRVKFVQGNSYWQSEMGQWEEPFPTANWKDNEIECEQVTKVAVTTYRYEPVENPE